MSGRFFLAYVVPVAYLLALVLAALSATSQGPGPRPPTALAVSQVVGKRQLAARPTPRPVPKRARHAVRAAARPHRVSPRVLRRSSVVAPAVAPISRSSYRVATVLQPRPALIIRIAAITTPMTMQAAIDACRGPIEIDWSADPARWGIHPSEIAQHDFCGGERFESLSTGDRVEVIGGTLSGMYVVNGDRRYAAAGSSANELDGIGDIAVQTCLAQGVVLIGLDRLS